MKPLPREPTPAEKRAARFGVFLVLSIPAFFFLAVGAHGVITGTFSHPRGGSTRGFHASVLSSFAVFAGLAWLRGAWLCARDGRLDKDDSILRFFLWLVVLSLGIGLGLLFFSVAT